MTRYRKRQLEASRLQPLFIVTVRMVPRDRDAVIKRTYVINGPSSEDVARRLRWHLDPSQWAELSITVGDAVPSGVYRLKEETQPAASIERPAAPSQGETQRTNQAPCTWAIGIVGLMEGRTHDGVLRRLGKFLLARANGTEGVSNPLRIGSELRVEAVSEGAALNVTDYLKGASEARTAHPVRVASTGSTR